MQKSTVSLVVVALVLFVAIFVSYSYKANSAFGKTNVAPPRIETGVPITVNPVAPVGDEEAVPEDENAEEGVDVGPSTPPKKPGLIPGRNKPVPAPRRPGLFRPRSGCGSGSCPTGVIYEEPVYYYYPACR